MFWETFVSLCNNKGISPNAVGKVLGISSGSISWWKKGKIPHDSTIQKLANYFGVSGDYLLGKTEQKEKPAEDGGLGENVVRFLGRDGKVLEKKLTPELLAYLESIPDSDDKL